MLSIRGIPNHIYQRRSDIIEWNLIIDCESNEGPFQEDFSLSFGNVHYPSIRHL
jgi:hypothetical protein